jgi:hypothetical protein
MSDINVFYDNDESEKNSNELFINRQDVETRKRALS